MIALLSAFKENTIKMRQNNLRPILLIEDDEIDVMSIERAFRDLGIPNELVIVSDGEKALEYLTDEAKTNPYYILLDLNLPKMNGFEFLEIIQKIETLSDIPIIILSSSEALSDRIQAYNSRVVGYMVKPLVYSELVRMIEIIYDYWNLSKFIYNKI